MRRASRKQGQSDLYYMKRPLDASWPFQHLVSCVLFLAVLWLYPLVGCGQIAGEQRVVIVHPERQPPNLAPGSFSA